MKLKKKHNDYKLNCLVIVLIGVPLIRDMYQQAFHLLRSRFYGYINSDIIMSDGIFDFLNLVWIWEQFPRM